MENTIFFPTRHTFRLFILLICFVSFSLHGMFSRQSLSPTARRIQPVKRPVALPVTQQLKPEKTEERSQASEQLRKEELEAKQLEAQRKKERLEAVEKQKELLQSHYPAMGLTIKGGMPSFGQERLKKERLEAEEKQKSLIKQLESTKPKMVKIQDQKGQSIYVPENIVKLSPHLSNALGFANNEQKTIILSDYSIFFPIFLIKETFDIIERKEAVSIDKQIKNYSLDHLIEMTNCLDSLGFSGEIQKPFHYKIYLLCKNIPFQALPQQLESLHPSLELDIFIEPVTQSLKNKIIKEFAILDDRDNILTVAGLPVNAALFSPNNKMFASGAGGISIRNLQNNFLLWKANSDGSINNDQVPQGVQSIEGIVSCLAFSPDSKNIAVGCFHKENNLFLCKIDSNGIINKTPQVLKGHNSKYITSVVFHPKGKMMISICGESKNNILLWTIKADGTAQGNPVVPSSIEEYRMDDATFSSDGTMLICWGRKTKRGGSNTIFIWNVNLDGTLQDIVPKKHIIPHFETIFNILFIPNSKRCILGGIATVGEESLSLCNVSNIDKIDCKSIKNSPKKSYRLAISPDGEILIATDLFDPYINLFTIQDNDTVIFNDKILSYSHCQDLSFSPDSNKIVSCYANSRNNIIIHTLLKENEKERLNDLKKLDAFQLSLIDKILDGAKDISIEKINEYEIPNNIIELLDKLNLISIPLHPKNPQLEKEKELIRN